MELEEIKNLSTNNIKPDAGDEDEIILLRDAEIPKPHPTISTGILKLDSYFKGSGFRKGEVNLISGLPKHGKTELALQITHNFSKAGIPCLWFSYEMPLEDLAERYEEMGIDKNELLFFAPKKNISDKIEWLNKKILDAKAYYPKMDIVFIDNLDFISAEVDFKDSKDRDRMDKKCLAMLKRIAIDNDLLIFLLVHVRKLDENREPRGADIHGDSAIYKLADNVVFIHRPYKKPAKRGEQSEYFEDYSKIIIIPGRRTKKIGSFKVKMINGLFVELIDTEYEG